MTAAALTAAGTHVGQFTPLARHAGEAEPIVEGFALLSRRSGSTGLPADPLVYSARRTEAQPEVYQLTVGNLHRDGMTIHELGQVPVDTPSGRMIHNAILRSRQVATESGFDARWAFDNRAVANEVGQNTTQDVVHTVKDGDSSLRFLYNGMEATDTAAKAISSEAGIRNPGRLSPERAAVVADMGNASTSRELIAVLEHHIKHGPTDPDLHMLKSLHTQRPFF